MLDNYGGRDRTGHPPPTPTLNHVLPFDELQHVRRYDVIRGFTFDEGLQVGVVVSCVVPE